ncbi:excalibur calcium-binding domain-containing protein [Actinomycetospora sp. CA-084318]|uniref:excalibur calcium-binding domain-containing protein n=1 Tax=Actinomycetospora sp. CA-084318 TaxID=3239892 RepID=UPI003D99F9C3
MKRVASAVAVATFLVLAPVGLAGTASAQTFSNCREAAAIGVFNIPAGTPGYRLPLDRDKDGIACERDGSDGAVGAGQDESVSDDSGSSRPDQVTVVPEGGAETGTAAPTPRPRPGGSAVSSPPRPDCWAPVGSAPAPDGPGETSPIGPPGVAGARHVTSRRTMITSAGRRWPIRRSTSPTTVPPT